MEQQLQLIPLLQQTLNPITPQETRNHLDHLLTKQLIQEQPIQYLNSLIAISGNPECPSELRLHALVLLRTVPLKPSPSHSIWRNVLNREQQLSILDQLFLTLLSPQQPLPTELIHHFGHVITELAKNCPESTLKSSDEWVTVLRPILLANLVPQQQQPPKPSNPILQTALLNIFVFLPWLFSSSSFELESIVSSSLNSNHFPLRLAALESICVPTLGLETPLTDLVHQSILLPLLTHPVSSEIESALSNLIEFVTFNDISNLSSWLDPLLQLVLNQNNLISIRTTALECLITVIECRIPDAKNVDWLQPVFHGIVNLMAEIEEDEDWSYKLEDDDQDQDAIYVQAEQALDRLAQEVANSHSEQLFQLILSSLQQPAPATWQARHALLSVLAVTGEALSKYYSISTERIYDVIQAGVEDSHPRVIYAAIYAIAQLSSPLKSIFSTQPVHQQVLNWLIRCLEKDSEPRIQAYSAKALINVLWDEKEEGAQYKKRTVPDEMIGPIIARLISACQSSYTDKKTLSNKIRLDALNAIKTLFSSISRDGALAFYDTTSLTLRNLLQQVQAARQASTGEGDELTDQDTDETELKVFEVIGRLAMACGHQKFDVDATWWANHMMAALESRTKGQTRILNSLARVSIGMKPERCINEGFLTRILERLLLVCKSKPNISISALLDDCHEFDHRQWESVVIGEQTYGIESVELADKELSVKTLILLVRHMGVWLITSSDQIVEAVIPLLKFYFSDDVRESAMTLLPALLQSAKASGLAVDQLSAISTSFCNSITDAFSVEPLDSCNLADSLLIGWADCVGIQVPSNEQVIKMVELCGERIERVKLESNNHRQEEYDSLEDEQYNDDLRRLFTAISRVLRISIRLLPDFMWTKFQNLVSNWVQLQSSASPIHLVLKRLGFRLVGAFVIYSSSSNSFGPELLSQVGQNILDGFQDEDECVRSLAPFIVGLCAEKNGELAGSFVYVDLIKSSVDHLVNGLQRQSSHTDSLDGKNREAIQITRENCVSALAKIIRNSEGVLMNAENILPQWIDALPIEIDVEEVDPSYGLLLELIARGHESVDPTKNEIQRVEQVIKSLITPMQNESTRIESRNSLKVGLRNYLAQLPQPIIDYKDQILNQYHSFLQLQSKNQTQFINNQPNSENHLLLQRFNQSVWVQLELLSSLN